MPKKRSDKTPREAAKPYLDQLRLTFLEFDLAELTEGIQGVGYWVVYGKENDDNLQQKLADNLVFCLESAVSTLPASADPEVADEQRSQLSSLWPALFLAFKHKHFEAEREFRVVYSATVVYQPLPISFRPKPLIPFVKIPMLDGWPLPLLLVRLGPAISHDDHKRSLEMALTAFKLGSIKVHKSSIPYVPR